MGIELVTCIQLVDLVECKFRMLGNVSRAMEAPQPDLVEDLQALD